MDVIKENMALGLADSAPEYSAASRPMDPWTGLYGTGFRRNHRSGNLWTSLCGDRLWPDAM